MTRFLRPVLSGLTYGLLACLWVLATELVYSRTVLPYPVRLDLDLLGFYALVFTTLGLVAGAGALVAPSRAAWLPATIVGALLAVLLLALRLHDLSDTPIGQPMDAGLIGFTALVAAAAVVLAARARSDAARRAAPAVLLGLSVPATVLAAKLLVDTAAIALARPLPVALALVAGTPLLLAGAYPFLPARGTGRRLVAAMWIVPAAIIAACAGDLRPSTAAPTVASAESPAAASPPIIWVTIDTLRADHMSVYGYPVPTTPHLEEFARTATLFRNAVAPSNTTAQSVPSLLGGITPYRHGGVSESRRLREDVLLIPEMLQQNGYETVAQSANHWVSPRYGMAQGFEDFRLYNTDNELVLYDVMKLAMRLAPWQVFRLREHLPSYAYVPIASMLSDTGEILRTRDRGRPLFLYMQPVDPHGPYQPPLRYVRTDGAFRHEDYVSYWDLKAGVKVTDGQRAAIRALYDGAIAYTDAQMGDLFDLLRSRDLFDQALIVVTSDHGEQFEEHGLWRHSNSLYQQLLHVPLMIKYPGQHEARVIDAPVGTIDVVPTVMRTLGLACPTCEGRPLQEAEHGGDPSRALFSYFMDHDEVRPVFAGVTTDGWKLVRSRKHDVVTEELFHVRDDPEDTHDELATHPEVAARLAGLISTYEAASGPAPAADSITLRPAELERLRALGYVQ